MRLIFALLISSCCLGQTSRMAMLGLIRNNPETTTNDGKQMWLSLGHSISVGYTNNDGTRGETPVANTVYEWTGTAELMVGANDMSTANSCSQWPKFGKTLNAGNGFKPIIVNFSVTGSQFYNSSTVGLSWYTNGTLYGLASKKFNSALSHYGLRKPAGIIIDLGINDVGNADMTTTLLAITSLIDRLRSDYSNVKIYIAMPGPNGLTTSANHGLIDWAIKDLETTYGDVYCVSNDHAIILSYAATFDNLHPNKSGYDKKGEILARYILNDTESDKDVRRIIACFYDDITTAQKAAIKTFITDDKADGTWQGRDGFLCFVSTQSKFNALIDWVGITSSRDPIGVTWNSGANLRTNGTTTYIDPFLRAGHLGRHLTLNDAFVECLAGVNSTAAGTLATLFGSNVPALRLYQSASSDVRYGIQGGDKIYTGITKIGDNKHHVVKRTASNATSYTIDGSVVDTGTNVSTSINLLGTYIGARNQNNTSVFEFMDNEFKLFSWGSSSTYNSAARARELTLLTAMATP